MEIRANLDVPEIVVEVSSRDEAKEFIDNAKANQGFVIPLPDRPEPFAILPFTFSSAGNETISFHAKLVQIFDQPGVGIQGAFQLDDWDKAKDQELARKLVAGSQDASVRTEGEHQGASPVYRIQQMDPGQRARLALSAGRAERQILCRDTTAQVLLNLLSNPRIASSDVLSIVKSTHANAGLLQRIAKDRRWMSNGEIVAALVRNPKTPTPISIRLLEQVPTRELREMAKMGGLRENVRRAAFRVYSKRSSRRG
jgi:hypothetical protein